MYTNIPTIAKLIIKNIITGIYPVFGNTLFATVVSFFVLFDVIVVVSSSFFVSISDRSSAAPPGNVGQSSRGPYQAPETDWCPFLSSAQSALCKA